MKRIIITGMMVISLFTFGCNNSNTDNEDHADSIGNEATPGNSPVTPNSNDAVVPNDQQTNTNGNDTAKIDSLVPPDTLKKNK